MGDEAAGPGIQPPAEARPRILLVSNEARSFLHFRMPLIRALQDRDVEVHAAAPEAEASDALSEEGVAFHAWAVDRRSMNPFKEYAAYRVLRRIYEQVQPTLTHHFTLKGIVHGSRAARKTGVDAVVNSVTGLGSVYLSTGMQGALRRRMLDAALRPAFSHPGQVATFLNPEDRDVLVGRGLVARGKTRVVPGEGVDIRRFQPADEPQGPPVFVLPARLLKDKGVVEFCDASAALNKDGNDARFALVGDVDPGNPSSLEPSWLEKRVASGVVEAWGWREDMEDVYRRAHVVVLPSYGEGLPMVLLEAMATGRPVIATDVPGCRHVVDAGATGLLVPARDADALAHAMRRLRDEPETRVRMGRAGRVLAEVHFSTARVLDTLFKLYVERASALASRLS